MIWLSEKGVKRTPYMDEVLLDEHAYSYIKGEVFKFVHFCDVVLR